MKNKQQQILEQALSNGARSAKVIPVDTIRTAAWVTMKCRFGCGHYGRSLCCPPYAPTYKEIREVLKDYSHAVLIQCETLEETTSKALSLERALFRLGYHKALGFGAGRCQLCQDCAMTQCSRPQDARPSMEACGMDVMATLKAAGMTQGHFADGYDAPDTANPSIYYGYGLVLIE